MALGGLQKVREVAPEGAFGLPLGAQTLPLSAYRGAFAEPRVLQREQ